MKKKTQFIKTNPEELTPVYDMGFKEPVGFIESPGASEIVIEWRCDACGGLVVEDKTHCPNCATPY